MARLVDIAAAAGVSVGLVSRVLNDSPAARASVQTRERIVQAAAELGYRPNFAGRALRLSRSGTIALVTPELVTNAMVLELMRGVEDEARLHDYTVLLARSESLTDRRQVRRLLETGRVDGYLLQGRDDATVESLTQLTADAPVVLVNSRLTGRPGSVMIDDRAAARTAVEHLLASGHQRIGLVNGLETSLTARLREEGFRAAMTDAGLGVDERWVTRFGYHVRDAVPAVEAVLGRGERPSALVVANVNAALGVLTHARALGVHVPDELSVIGIHDAWTADHTWPPLTTVALPLHDLGRAAVNALHQRFSATEGVDLVVDTVPPTVVERASVRALR